MASLAETLAAQPNPQFGDGAIDAVKTGMQLAQQKQQQILMQKNELGSLTAPTTFSFKEKQIVQQSVENAFVYSFRWAMGINAFLAFLSAFFSYIYIRPEKK